MKDVIVSWTDSNIIEKGHKIYKSNTPMNIENLPPPLDTLSPNATQYIDANQIIGTTSYYIVSAYIDGHEEFSEQIEYLVEERNGPGPTAFIGGDETHGFYGEINASEFITGDALATAIGLTAGISQFSDTPWLKYSLNDEIIYIPKKPIRHSISWEHIYQVGAVYGTDDNGLYPSGGDRVQDAMVSIDGFDFSVTLLKGGNSDPVSSNTTGYDRDWTHGSEWNKLMYPVHSGIHTTSSNPSSPSEPYNQWASYSDGDLLIHRDFGNGSYTWTQEQHPGNSTYRVLRGWVGVTYANLNATTHTNTTYGFRPALRLVR